MKNNRFFKQNMIDVWISQQLPPRCQTKVFLTFPIAGHARPGWAEIRWGPGPARAQYFIFHHIRITPIGGPGPGPGPVFYLSSPYTHHSYWQVFYLSSPYTHHSYWPVFYLSSLYTHHSTIPKNGRVMFSKL